jgi:tRNA(Ile)-lysidine synthase
MLRIFGDKLPRTLYVALSGGPDSMAVLDFLIKGGRDVTALHFDHGTGHGKLARKFVSDYCKANNVKLVIGEADRPRDKNESPEEYWRNMRYDFFNEHKDSAIVTGHTLDDQVENYLFTSMHGNPRIIPYRRFNIIRPFITTTKREFLLWCENKSVPFVVDSSNFSDRYARSYIRKHIVPHAITINPGIYKVIKKKVIAGGY